MSADCLNPYPWDFHPVRILYTAVYGSAAALYHISQRLRHRIPVAALAERWGRYSQADAESALWVHASSMGEVRVAAGLIGCLAKRQPQSRFVWSTSTETGYHLAQSLAGMRSAVTRAPVDVTHAVRRYIDRVRPRALILIETEWWPNQLVECFRRGVPVFVANGRVSVGAAKRYRWLRRYLRPLLRRVDRFYMRSPADAERLIALGVDQAQVEVAGSLKNVAMNGEPVMREKTPAGPPVFVAGCTRPGEEAIILDAYRIARERVGELRLWLAPRHPERFAEVAAMFGQSDQSWKAYSSLSAEQMNCHGGPPIVLVDQMGVLAKLYERARVAFVGGSLRPFGGHNPVEPVQAGAPVLFGPHTEEQADAAAALVQAGLGRCVHDAPSLAQAVIEACTVPVNLDAWNAKRREFFSGVCRAADHVAADILSRIEAHNPHPA